MTTFTKFNVLFEELVKRRFIGREQTEPDDYIKALERTDESISRTGEEFFRDIAVSLGRCKFFEIDEDIKKLLLLTKAPKDNRDLMLPFDYIFIDARLSKQELRNLGIRLDSREIFGILIRRGRLVSDLGDGKTKEVGKNLRISMGQILPKKEGEWVSLHTFNVMNVLTYNPVKEWKNPRIKTTRLKDLTVNDRRVITDFVVNFINFVNNPEIRIVEFARGEKNTERRIKRGKRPLPSSYRVILKGYLKIYLEQVRQGRFFKYSHRFWVRGHFRTLMDRRYGENVGKRIWILPFIKGQGILIDKKYHLKQTEGDEQ